MLVLSFALDSCNNNDILLVEGYNYNIIQKPHTEQLIFLTLMRLAINAISEETTL